jgi:hypothetical protein
MRLGQDLNDAEAKLVGGTGRFIGTKPETGIDAEQRPDARLEYERIIKDAHDAGKLAGRDVGAAFEEIRDRWGAQTLDPKVVEVGVTR